MRSAIVDQVDRIAMFQVMRSSTVRGDLYEKNKKEGYVSQPQSERYDQPPTPVRCDEVLATSACFRWHFVLERYSNVKFSGATH